MRSAVQVAQGVAKQLAAAGVGSILNFAPLVLTVADGVLVRNVDLALELQVLSFYQGRSQPVALGATQRTGPSWGSPANLSPDD